jgi:hypothetical protein
MADRFQKQREIINTEEMMYKEFLAWRQQAYPPMQKATPKKGAKKKKTPQRTEFEFILAGSLILFCIGYYFCQKYGLIT